MTPKMLREALCVAQGAVRRFPGYSSRAAEFSWYFGELIAEIDRIRPLDRDGKHRDLHTNNCGCEGHRGSWSLSFPGRS